MQSYVEDIIAEIEKVILGKHEVIEKIMMAMLAQGHVLLDDVPGVGKTTLASTLGNAIGLQFGRIQFTPDVLPGDIVGFTLYNQGTYEFEYRPGIATQVNLLLCDEINRTSSKTQSALLEAMEERQVTVDGTTHLLPVPFMVIATQNNVGAVGTQLLPAAQLDRFLVRLSVGYPDYDTQMRIIRDRMHANPAKFVRQVASTQDLLNMQGDVMDVHLAEDIIAYITRLVLSTRADELLELGVSPRGALALASMARACAYVRGRGFVIPEDVAEVFLDVCAHRVVLSRAARAEGLDAAEVLGRTLAAEPIPDALK